MDTTQADTRSTPPGSTLDQPLAVRFPQRATEWRLRSRTLRLPRRPLLMGILNVTPDSFSDGGRHLDPAAAVDEGLRLEAEGADIIDVGGESTRPYSQPVSAAEELRRVAPVIEQLLKRGLRAPISIDTSKAAVAREALAAGAEIVNDVTGVADPEMLSVAVDLEPALCVMHMLGNPQTMQDDPRYENVVAEVLEYLRGRQAALLAAGVLAERVALDPGIGFGKTHAHNVELLANCHRLHALGSPVLVGHSRKAFIAKIIGDKQADRMPGVIGVALSLARQGVQIIRVHDVGPVRQALQLFEATGGIDGQPLVLA